MMKDEIQQIFNNKTDHTNTKYEKILTLLTTKDEMSTAACMKDDGFWSTMVKQIIPLQQTRLCDIEPDDYQLLYKYYREMNLIDHHSSNINDAMFRILNETYNHYEWYNIFLEKDKISDAFFIFMSFYSETKNKTRHDILKQHYHARKCEGLCHKKAEFKSYNNHYFCSDDCYITYETIHRVT